MESTMTTRKTTPRYHNRDQHYAIYKRTSRHRGLLASTEYWDGPFATLNLAMAAFKRSYDDGAKTFLIVCIDYEVFEETK
jgi:hypothetical protein